MEKELPIGWVETELHVVSEILDNLRKPINSTERGGRIGNIPYYGATGQAGWIDDFLFDEELVLVGEDGAPFFDKTKNVAYLVNGKSWVNNHAHVLKAISKISSNKFLLHFLNQFDYKDFVGGTTRLKLTQGDLKIIPIPLPPLPEQQRIVAKLDTLFGHLDALKTRLDRIPQLLKDFRHKVFTQAVTGKLTEDWREGKELEDIKILFSKMDFRRGQHKKSKISNLKLDLRSDLDLFELPSKWSWADLNFLMDEENSFCYGVVQPGKDVKNEQKLIRVQDLSNGKILNDQLRGISWKIDKEYTRSKVNEGDLLVTVVGTIGRTAIVAKENIGLNIARAVAKIPVRDCNGKYIRIFFDSEIAQQWLVGDAREVARKTLNLDQLKTLPIAVPPIEEQQEIVRRVESLFAKADQIEASYQKLKTKIEQLPQALLAKAFRGELVEQLPTDGDARELLKQIKMAKAGLEKGGRTKKMKENDEVRMVAEDGARYGKK